MIGCQIFFLVLTVLFIKLAWYFKHHFSYILYNFLTLWHHSCCCFVCLCVFLISPLENTISNSVLKLQGNTPTFTEIRVTYNLRNA